MGEVLLSDRLAGPLEGSLRVSAGARRAARRTLRAQIGRLEAELADSLFTAFQMRASGEAARPPGPAFATAPRMLDLGELEIVRDELAQRLRAIHDANECRAREQEEKRALLERMKLEPGRYRFTRISAAEIGEPGCGVWSVGPRLGLIGMLAGWWQVKLSSGCPLAGGVVSVAAPSICRV
jgi:hypothetical protein